MEIIPTSNGEIELWLSSEPENFRTIAEFVKNFLGGEWLKQADGLDQSYWELSVEGQTITVHREHYLGVAIFTRESEPTRRLLEKVKAFFDEKSKQGGAQSAGPA